MTFPSRRRVEPVKAKNTAKNSKWLCPRCLPALRRWSSSLKDLRLIRVDNGFQLAFLSSGLIEVSEELLASTDR